MLLLVTATTRRSSGPQFDIQNFNVFFWLDYVAQFLGVMSSSFLLKLFSVSLFIIVLFVVLFLVIIFCSAFFFLLCCCHVLPFRRPPFFHFFFSRPPCVDRSARVTLLFPFSPLFFPPRQGGARVQRGSWVRPRGGGRGCVLYRGSILGDR